VGAYGTQHLGAETLLVVGQQAKDARHAADAVADFGEQFGGRARAE
jgi:hypothetical protein